MSERGERGLMKRLASIDKLVAYRERLQKTGDSPRVCVRVCMTGCRAYGASEVKEALVQEVHTRGLDVEVRETGCQGFCAMAPVVAIDPQGLFYQEVRPEDASQIVEQTLMKGEAVPHLLYKDPRSGEKIPLVKDIPFYKGQVRRVLAKCGLIDPKNIDHYILQGGYGALAKVLISMSPEEVVEQVKKAKLRGRGGAGFPTGVKWGLAREASGTPKYIVCNADEGDPGAFMDRAVLEGDPHAVLEGMLIAAFAIGAEQGFIYVREEYPIAVEHLTIAISQAEQMGFLGEDILGTGLNFQLGLKMGAGAFVCGEETALMASIEGRRGMPRPRPPFPAQAGIDGRPTNINNVETFANVPMIINHGPEWYTTVGTEESGGTKVFSLAGKVNNTGLVEVPIGTTIRKVIFDIGGGIPKGRRFKAVQMGGPSGGCVPERYLDLPIDYGTLQAIGSIMGSGGMVVMDENNCMVEIARYFLSFSQTESCGKCSPCRLGTKEMLDILTRITQGQGIEGDIEILSEIANVVQRTSLCGLGQTCPKSVLSTINYFRDEYEAHILDRRCPGAVCEGLVISACQHACPVGVNAPKYLRAIVDGNYSEAAEIIRERNPFPGICGRICHHPCEVKCRRGELDDPVAIRALKRFAADWYFQNVQERPEPFSLTKHERVAVIGAGPAGLTCAFYLRRMGYPVTVFEALSIGGGMLAVAIPEFRLPKWVIEKDIQYIQDRGVEIRYNTPINVNYTIEDLMREGYRAIFIAAGTQKSQRIGIPGEEEGLEGLHFGLSFLRDVKMGKGVRIGERVAVIGGGNTAIDSARTALRLGAKEVNIFYRRNREEMPVTEVEFEGALEEGVKINFLVNPTRVLRDDGKVKGLECIRMRLGEADETGRRRPIPIEETEFQVEADTVIPAVGQAPDLSFLTLDTKLERSRWDALKVDSNTLATNIPGIFAGGDFVTGPAFVIEAIAAGRRGAVAIDKYLRGEAGRVELIEEKEEISPEVLEAELEEVAKEKPRRQVPLLSPEQRLRGFAEIELGFSDEEAQEEANRCLRCDLER
jgi:NADH-quinone oxidoreductase subunit F